MGDYSRDMAQIARDVRRLVDFVTIVEPPKQTEVEPEELTTIDSEEQTITVARKMKEVEIALHAAPQFLDNEEWKYFSEQDPDQLPIHQQELRSLERQLEAIELALDNFKHHVAKKIQQSFEDGE